MVVSSIPAVRSPTSTPRFSPPNIAFATAYESPRREESLVRTRLPAGGSRIRTLGPPSEATIFAAILLWSRIWRHLPQHWRRARFLPVTLRKAVGGGDGAFHWGDYRSRRNARPARSTASSAGRRSLAPHGYSVPGLGGSVQPRPGHSRAAR